MRKPIPIHERGNPPYIRGGQGRSDEEVEDTGVWFTLFILMTVAAILAGLLGLAAGGGQ